MNQYFIIGDIHGCLHTLQNVLTHWNPERQHLVFVGDLIDRGNFSPGVVGHVRALQANPRYRVTVVKGNHEAEMIRHFAQGPNWWYNGMGGVTIHQYYESERSAQVDAMWMAELPLKFETDDLLVTHAGVCDTLYPYVEDHPHSVLWSREPIKHVGKLQIYGHTPQQDLRYDRLTNSMCIDTGAYQGRGLSAVLVEAGRIVAEVREATWDGDVD